MTNIQSSSDEVRRLAYRAAWRKFELDAAERREAFAGERREVLRPGFAGVDGFAEDCPYLLLHGAAVFRGPYAQAGLHVVVEIADRDARHRRSPVAVGDAPKLSRDCSASKDARIGNRTAARQGRPRAFPFIVMPGLVPGIHVGPPPCPHSFTSSRRGTWIPGTSPGMTEEMLWAFL